MHGHRARRRSQGANLKGQEPMGLAVLKSGMTITEAELQQQLVNRIRDTFGAITCYKDTVIMARLPKTRSGKTLRKTLAPLIVPF
jgi:propionyl-CoA synthetase